MDGDDILQTLMDMGFTRERCDKALSETGNSGIEAAANWLLSHPEVGSGHTLGTADNENAVSKEASIENPDNNDASQLKPSCLKCDDCGKKFKNELDAQAHAARTKHANFSESTDEIKPMTAEEKKEALARLEAKKLQKRAEREDMEKLEAKTREKVRRKTGQEVSQIKHEMELKEARKIADLKKREKLEEKRAREKVKEEIAKDKAERAARLKGDRPSTNEQQASTPPTTVVKKDYDACRLQIRLFGGQTLVNSFKASDSLVDVNRYILMNRTDDGAPFSLMTSYPRHTFTAEETSKSLQELGLVPSSVLILTKP